MTEKDNIQEVDQPIRQNMVNTAVNFLLNPEVRKQPDGSKEAFLKKKGLTSAEIAQAYVQAKSDPRYTSDIIYVNRQNHFVPPPVPRIERPYSFWSQLTKISSSLVVLGVALYGLHRFYQIYIEPWLFGKETEISRLGQMEQQLLEVNRSLSQLKKMVSAMEATVHSQKEQMDNLNELSECVPTSFMLKDLKNEVGSIKSLLLGRHQFPAVPKVSPTIPIWQKRPDSEDKPETDDKGDDLQITPLSSESVLVTDFENIEALTNGTGNSDQGKDCLNPELTSQTT